MDADKYSRIQKTFTFSSKETGKIINEGLEYISLLTGTSMTRIIEAYLLTGLIRDTADNPELHKQLKDELGKRVEASRKYTSFFKKS